VRQSSKLRLGADAPPAHAVHLKELRIQGLVGDGRRGIQLSLRLLDDDLQLPSQLIRIQRRVDERVRLHVEGL